MKELKITRGVWTVKWHNGLAHVFSENLMSICRIDNCFDKETADTNAQLIAEAGTVANQCGLTPKELLEQVEHSKEVIEELVKALEESNTQIEYLHQKFKETGTGNAVLSRNSTIIQKHRNNEKQG